MVNFPEPEGISRTLVLDAAKRNRIIAMLVNGSSRRMAAAYVGCAPSTITRTAKRDPQFALEIAQAEQNCEIQSLRAIRKAAQEPRYWRAAAWLLERRNPDDFAPRKPNTLTAEEMFDVFAKVTLEEVTDQKQYRRIMDRLTGVLGLPPMDDEDKELSDDSNNARRAGEPKRRSHAIRSATLEEFPPSDFSQSPDLQPHGQQSVPSNVDDVNPTQHSKGRCTSSTDSEVHDVPVPSAKPKGRNDEQDKQWSDDHARAPRPAKTKAHSHAPFATLKEFLPRDFSQRSDLQPHKQPLFPSIVKNLNPTQRLKGRCTRPIDYEVALYFAH